MARAGHVEHVEVARPDRPVEVRVDEVQAGRRAEVPEQARLDVLGLERLAEQRVVEQVDLPDREVVRGPPVRVEQLELGGRQWAGETCSLTVDMIRAYSVSTEALRPAGPLSATSSPSDSRP